MEAPFKVGQKVVCLISGKQSKKGCTYTVLGLEKCGSCNTWYIDIGFKRIKPYSKPGCIKCRTEFQYSDIAWSDSSRFAPIQEQRERINYVAVSETLREKALETFTTQTN